MRQLFPSGRACSRFVVVFGVVILVGGFLFAIHSAYGTTYYRNDTHAVTDSLTSSYGTAVFATPNSTQTSSVGYVGFDYVAGSGVDNGFVSNVNSYGADSITFAEAWTGGSSCSWNYGGSYWYDYWTPSHGNVAFVATTTDGTYSRSVFSVTGGGVVNSYPFHFDSSRCMSLSVLGVGNNYATLFGSTIPFIGNSNSGGGWNVTFADTAAEALAMSSTPPQSYYAQMQGGTHHLYEAEDTSTILKTLPADWIIHVESSTDGSGDPMVSGGYHWFKVSDPTDGTMGWMAASNTTSQYISSYDGSAQADLEASSSYATTGYVATSSRPAMILGAIDHYYNNTDTSSSLYSSDDGSNDLSIFSDRSYPELLIAGIAAVENSTYADPVFDNEVISYDYGHGIMQLTAKATSSDILYLETLLDRDPDTALATGTPDDTFDDVTQDAVNRFQVKYWADILAPAGLPTSTGNGVVGYYTRQKLNSFLPTSSIPSDFTFQELLSETANNPDKTANPFDHRGEATGLAIPPCGTLGGFSGTNFFKNCYANSPDTTEKHYTSDSDYGGQVFKYYTNTPQSIYSNIKDGMRDLQNKFPTHQITTSTDINIDGTTTTFSGVDREAIIVTASYNGQSSYLSSVATDTANIAHFFSGQDSSGLSDLINKMYLASDNSVYVQLHSPGDLSIQDNHGHTIGVVNGIVENTFPLASYDPDTKLAEIFFPQGNLTYKVKGTGSGVYGLDITVTSGTQQIAFHRDENVPITPGEVHTYTIDPSAVANGQAGVTFKIDKKGNGTINSMETFDATSTAIEGPTLLPFSGAKGNGRFYFPPAPPKPIAPVFVPPPTRINISTSTMNLVTSTINFATSTINAETTSSMINLASSTFQLATSTNINSSTQD